MQIFPHDAPKPQRDFADFDRQIAAALNHEIDFSDTRLTFEMPPSNGRFLSAWRCPDGTYICHQHSWATGMGFLAARSQYLGQFNQKLPAWVLPLPPAVIRQLCKIAIRAARPLPLCSPPLQHSCAIFARISAIAKGGARVESGNMRR